MAARRGRGLQGGSSKVLPVLLLGVAALFLTSCRPMYRTITYDLNTRKWRSDAERRVAPIDTQHGPGIDIRMRGCQRMAVAGTGDPSGDRAGPVFPVARITDATGHQWLIGNGEQAWAFLDTDFDHSSTAPAGTWVADTKQWDEVDRMVVPVKAMHAPLRIESGCFEGNSRVNRGFSFAACTTSTRSCPSTRRGTAYACYFCISGP